MAVVSGKVELANLIPEIWATNMYTELRNQLLFGGIFSREYEGEVRSLGDTVKVNQLVAPEGEILSNDKDTFNSEVMSVNQFSVVVNKRAVASFEFTSLAQLQSQSFERDAQEALIYAVNKQIESDIIAALIPSATAPDHDIAPVSAGDLDASDVAGIRTLLSSAKVPKTNRWLLADPQYFGDLLQKTNFINSQYVPAGSPVSSAEFGSPLYGFMVAEHDLLAADTAYAVHPSALQMVMQQDLRIKISDLHAQSKFGFKMSADLVYGISLFDNTRLVKISG